MDDRRKRDGSNTSKQKAQSNTKKAENADLKEIGQKDRGTIRPQRPKCGNHMGFTREIGADRSRNTHTADRKPGQSDKDQERPQTLDKF